MHEKAGEEEEAKRGAREACQRLGHSTSEAHAGGLG